MLSEFGREHGFIYIRGDTDTRVQCIVLKMVWSVVTPERVPS